MMCSAAYWLGSVARSVAAPVTASLGSIGVRTLHIDWSGWNEKAGLRLLDVIGEDHVMFESDYPHSICNWPNTQKVINDICEGLSPATRQKVLADNAVRLYQLN